MKKKVTLSNKKILSAVKILTKFVEEAKVTGISATIRYWIGWNKDHVESASNHYDRERKKLIELYGDVAAVRKEKIDEFLTAIFGELSNITDKHPELAAAYNRYSDRAKDIQMIPKDMFDEMKDAQTSLAPKFDAWIKKNPMGTQKEMIAAKNMVQFNRDIEEIMELENELEIMTFELDKVEHLADDPDFGLLISSLPFMWDEPTTESPAPPAPGPDQKKK